MRVRVIALLATAALGIGACGDDGGGSADLVPAIPAGAATTETEATTATSPSTTGKPFKLSSIKVSTTKGKKPTITKPSGDPPTKLVTKDIFAGKGPAAQDGDKLSMQYLGALYADGKQFEASWDSGQPFDFTLGQGDVIPGWDQGIKGMKAGGRRLLVIPSELAYGADGQGDIPPNAPLIFVVDLLERSAG